MSLSEIMDIECPSCKTQDKVTYWGTVNVQENPELKKKLYDGELNQFVCTKCEYEAFLKGSLIYLDLDKKFSIHLSNAETDKELKEEIHYLNGSLEMMEKTFSMPIFENTFRVVLDKNDLIEKINIFDSELDDRVIEMLKLYIYNEFLRQYNDATVEVFFLGVLENDSLDFLVFQGDEKMQTSLTREVYDEIDKKFIGMSEEFGLTKGKWQLFNRESVLEALDNKT